MLTIRRVTEDIICAFTLGDLYGYSKFLKEKKDATLQVINAVNEQWENDETLPNCCMCGSLDSSNKYVMSIIMNQHVSNQMLRVCCSVPPRELREGEYAAQAVLQR